MKSTALATMALVLSGTILLACMHGTNQNTTPGAAAGPTATVPPEPPVQIEANLIETGSGESQMRLIAGFMEEGNFTREELERVFLAMSKEYPDPQFMRIDLYSDREMTRRWSIYLREPKPGDGLPGLHCWCDLDAGVV